MGILKITPRRESLQSGHTVGAGQVHIPSLPTSRNTGEIQKWRGVGDLGRGAADLGDKMLKIAVSLQEERNEMELNEFESDFLNSLRGVTMDPEKGLFTRNLSSSKDIDALANDGPKAVKDVFDEVAERHGFTGNKRTWAEHRVRGAVLSTQGRIVERVAGAHRQLKITTANNLTQAQLVHWRDNPADQNATLDLIDSYRAQQYASGYDDQAVELKVGQFVGDIAAEYATQSFKALPDEKAVDDMLGKLEKDPSAILAGNQVLAGQFSTKNPFDPKTTDQLKGALEARRREIQARDMHTVSDAANVGIAAVAQIRDKDGNYPTGRLSTIEASIGSLQRIQATLPKESDAATRAATRISELDLKADMIAQQEMIDEYLNELKTNPKAKIYAPETKNEKGEVSPARNAYIGSGRKERLAPMVQQHFDVQRMKERHPQEVAALRSKMLSATASPGNFVCMCDQSLKDGRISLPERNELVEDFMKDWTKNGKPQLAQDILFSIQAAFPDAPISASFEWSAKESAMVPVKKPDLEKLTYKRKKQGDELSSSFKRFFNPYGAWGYDLQPEKDSLSLEQVADLVRVAGNLGAFDGKVIDYDPILGGSKEGKDFFGDEIKKDQPFSARAYFNKYLSRLKDVKKADKAGDYIERWINAEAHMREIELQRQEKAGIR